MSTNTQGAKGQRPVRTLIILMLVLIIGSATAVLTKATTINLGLDLRGGTSVTLQPRISDGDTGKVTSEAIDQAVSIIRSRVNSLGVAESEVTAQGSGTNRQIVISVPGSTGRRIVELVGNTAELRFRQVLAESASGAAAGTGEATPVAGVSPEINAAYAAIDCTTNAARQNLGGDTPEQTIVTCARNSATKYILGPAEVVGREVSKASAGLDTQAGNVWTVALTFDNDGTKKFGALTQRVTSLAAPQNQVAIVLDGLVVSAPRINEAIVSGNAQITGSFTQVEASDLANVLKYGSLPLAFDRGEVQQISPTLGENQLHAGLLAGGLGLFLVLLYMFAFYRGLGIVSAGSLLMAMAFTYVTFALLGETIGFTLTLAGIAGAIVSIGITADSFIVFFERIRDEIREGRSLRSAVETGWVRARRTILVADFVSILAAALLYFFAVGGVRGFAFALGIATFIDLLVVFFFTKPLMTILGRTKFYNSGSAITGVSRKSLGLEA
ncbi:MAG: protein translocase subunit SecD [Candidatus Nanopelagicaceae bacterium]|nr:protein translocase subunit SecD [Candidatus Nanopelagicaceae bacterium]